MSLVAARGREAPAPTLAGPLRRATGIAALLAVAIGLRWAATVEGRADALAVGGLFGVALLALALLAGGRPGWRGVARGGGSVVLGSVGGAVLVALALLVRWPGPWVPFAPAAAFAPWAVVTVLVAWGEELVLRGALFDAIDEVGGLGAAVIATAVAFALLHVPLYGWHVVPLDLGVGLFLGGLRILSGGTLAPAIAHAVADLATWWL